MCASAAAGCRAEGGEKKTTLACDEDSLWKAVAAQRGGRELPDEERGSSKLVRSLWESLQDQDGRRLPDVDLATVSSHAGKGYDGPTEASTDGGEGEEASGKKAKKEGPGGLGKYTLLRLLRVVFNSLAAVSSTSRSASRISKRSTQSARSRRETLSSPTRRPLPRSPPRCASLSPQTSITDFS